MTPIEALTQGVELPLWLHWLTLAYTTERIARMGTQLLGKASDMQDDRQT